MPSAVQLRSEIEAALSRRIPSALTPRPRTFSSFAATGIVSLDEALEGGLAVGAITEIAGRECSGRTSLALSFLAGITQTAKVCAWVDVSDALDPESAAAAGVDLERLLWIRCGVTDRKKFRKNSSQGFVLPEKYFIPAKIVKGLHGGGFGPHPRGEGKGLPDAIHDFLGHNSVMPQHPVLRPQRRAEPTLPDSHPTKSSLNSAQLSRFNKPWSRIEQALRATDLLLQAGGFRAIVLDMASLAPEYALRVPLATWFRYRAAGEQSQTSLLLLTQQACAKSSAGLVLHMGPANPLKNEATVFTGVQHAVEVIRERFQPVSAKVVPMRKPPQSERGTSWQSETAWGCRR
ncbi:MAG: recombinase RecA [Acidobacteriaceae bacterium]